MAYLYEWLVSIKSVLPVPDIYDNPWLWFFSYEVLLLVNMDFLQVRLEKN